MLIQVKASAGSGKTHALTQKFLSLVLRVSRELPPACALAPDSEYSLQEILAVTFTNKAAAEMRDRVIAKLKAMLVWLAGLSQCAAALASGLCEREFVEATGEIHRPDVLFLGQTATEVIDFKTGRAKPEYAAQVARYLALAKAMPRTTPLALETDLRASLDLNGTPRLLTGRIDRLDRRGDGAVILDYKTGSLTWHKTPPWDDEAFFAKLLGWRGEDDGHELLAETARRVGSVQLPLYCWLQAATAGELPVDAAFVELRAAGAEKPLFGSRVDPAVREEAITRQIPQLLGFILRHLIACDAFAPRPEDRRCAFCDFRPACGAK